MSPPRDFTWHLGELPSAQHRAGLAGLVLFLRWLEKEPDRVGTAHLLEVAGDRASVSFDEEGLAFVFDHVYAASTELQPRPAVLKHQKTKEVIPPAREDEVEVKDERGKVKLKKRYWYPITVPKGGPIDAWDRSEKKLWLKLWRDMVWSIPRGIPAQRKPFDDRAESAETTDAADAWKTLIGGKAVELGSTLFFGAQAVTAEKAPFRDQGRFEFLLHFQPFVLQIYVPTVFTREGKSEFDGFALVIPDIADLQQFCEDFPLMLRERDGKAHGYRPARAVVELPVSGGLDLSFALRKRVTAHLGAQEVRDTLSGCEVLHLAKDGNNIRMRGLWRIVPDAVLEGAHERLRTALWAPLFRRQRLENLVRGRPAFDGFDRLLTVQPMDVTLDDDKFRHDVRLTFEELEPEMSDKPTDLASLVHQVVGRYLAANLDEKKGLTWKAAKENPEEKDAYNDARRKLGRSAFLAVRGRTGADFVEFFVGTLCSVSQSMNEDSFHTLAAALADENKRDEVRTLTLLALAARS